LKRIFIGIPIPDDLKNKLYSIVKNVLPEKTFKKVMIQNYHITLKFLGNVNEKEINELIDLLENFKFNKFRFNINCINAFPAINNARIVWAGCLENNYEFQKLNSEIEDLCELYGFEKELRKFHPHITLARKKRKYKKIDLSSDLKNFEFKEYNIMINKIVLYESLLKPECPEYVVLKQIFLD
jgi:2'-5' RNA ligase